VIVAVYCVLTVRLLAGVNVATEPAATYVTGPVTATPPTVVFRVKVFALMVAAFKALLKVAVMAWLIGTLVALFEGVVAITASAAEVTAVRNVHTSLLARGSAGVAVSVAPVLIVAV
jgi:hypothetical protein